MSLTYFDADRVLVRTGDIAALSGVALRCASDARMIMPSVAVALQVTGGGWHVFDTPDFLGRCLRFDSSSQHSSEDFETIFGIADSSRAAVILDDRHAECSGPRAVVLEDDVLIGVFVDLPEPTVDVSGSVGTEQTVEYFSRRSYVRLEKDERRGAASESATFSLGSSSPIIEEAAAPPDPSAEEAFVRTPHLSASVERCPPAGGTIDIDVYCDVAPPKEGESSDSIVLVAPANQDVFEIEVFISPAAGLHVAGESSKRFKAFRSREESDHVGFKIAVDQTPTTEHVDINAYFFCDGRPCGRVTRSLPARDGAAVPLSEGRLKVVTANTPTDLIVSVTQQSGAVGTYRVKITSPHLRPAEIGEPCLWSLGEDSRDFVAQRFRDFIKSRDDNSNRLASLLGSGKQLFEAAPENFRKVYEHLFQMGALKTILIVSDEPYVPWELMVPRATKDETANNVKRRPIGVEHVIGRWITDEHFSPGERLKVERVFVVAPDYRGTQYTPLAFSAQESAYLKERFHALILAPTEYPNIVSAMSSRPPDLFHFIGHGNSALAGTQQCLIIEGKDMLTPDVLRGEQVFSAAFAQRTPVVFLNACEVGQQTLAFGGPSGFVSALIKLYASSVIAPLWSVSDAIAHKVAKSVYSDAVPLNADPVPVAEILRRIREQAYDGVTAGQDSYAAYCFYGDPNFVIDYAP